MNNFRLKTYELSPPGGYPYLQTQGIRKGFASVPIIEDQARVVSDFRTRNKLDRASFKESLEDVDAFQCQRLGNMPQWCCPVDPTQVQLAAVAATKFDGKCKGCGAPIMT